MKLAIFALLVATAHGSSVQCNVLDAAGSKCTGTCTTSTPTPVKGTNFTITAKGICTEDVTAASYDCTGKFAGLPVINQHCDDACKDSDFAIGGALNMGHMYIAGAGCPVTQGNTMTIVSTAYVGTTAPGGTLTSELTAKDSAGNKLLDLQVVISL